MSPRARRFVTLAVLVAVVAAVAISALVR